MIRNATRTLAASVLGGLLVAPATAQAPATPPQKASDPNQVICEKQEVVGSRLATRRICRTRAEWAHLRLQDRQEIERVQVQGRVKDGQ